MGSAIEIRSAGAEDLVAEPSSAKKPLATIDIRLLNKPITFLQHRIYNTWIAFAQATRDAENTVRFTFPLNDVMELSGYTNTKDTRHFVESAEGIMGLHVKYDSISAAASPPDVIEEAAAPKRRGRKPKLSGEKGPSFHAIQLVSEVKIDPATNTMLVEWPSVIREQIIKPEVYRAVGLEKQTLFSTRAALALYECSLIYAGEGSTPKLTWQEYSSSLCGTVEPHKTFREFAKVLTRAVKQVNDHHDTHRVRAVAFKRSKAIEKLQFVIEPKEQGSLQFGDVPVPEGLVKELAELGIAREVCEYWCKLKGPSYVIEHLQALRTRQAAKTDKPFNPAGWLVVALRNNHVANNRIRLEAARAAREKQEAPKSKRIAPAAPEKPAPKVQPDEASSSTRAFEWMRSLSDEEKDRVVSSFMATSGPVIAKRITDGGMSSPIVRAALAEFIQAWPGYLYLSEQGSDPNGKDPLEAGPG
jgi:hypothetical protein